MNAQAHLILGVIARVLRLQAVEVGGGDGDDRRAFEKGPRHEVPDLLGDLARGHAEVAGDLRDAHPLPLLEEGDEGQGAAQAFPCDLADTASIPV